MRLRLRLTGEALAPYRLAVPPAAARPIAAAIPGDGERRPARDRAGRATPGGTIPMTNKQIHELPRGQPAGARRPGARLATPEQPHAARQPRRPAVPAATARAVPAPSPASSGDVVSVKDFGAVGDGSANDRAAFQAALDQHAAIHVPAGTYRLDGEVQVKPRRRLFGAGRDVTVIDARGPRAFTLPPQCGRLPGRRRRAAQTGAAGR